MSPLMETNNILSVLNSRDNTSGAMFEQAVDKTLNDKDFMNFGEEKKRYSCTYSFYK